MIVTDTNVVAYLYVESAQTLAAERALLRDPEWAAPLLWRSELRNVLALYVRQELLEEADALRILEEAELLLAGREYEVASRAVLELAMRSGCSAYDCEFVFLAQDLGVQMVSSDRKLIERFPDTVVSLAEFGMDPGGPASKIPIDT